MFVANIAFERFDAPPERRWVRFGSLWVHGALGTRLKLTGVRVGPFAGRLKEGIDGPYVAGDLFANIGELIGPSKMEQQWIGHIQTSDNSGVVYFGEIFVVPVTTQSPLWVMVKE